MVSDGKVVSCIYTYVYMYVSLTLTLVFFFLVLRFFLCVCVTHIYIVTINLSAFISYVVWWTHLSIHLTPSLKLMTELIQCKYDLPFRLTVSNSKRRWREKKRRKKKPKIKNERPPPGHLYSHYYSNRSNITWRTYYAYFLSLSLSLPISLSYTYKVFERIKKPDLMRSVEIRTKSAHTHTRVNEQYKLKMLCSKHIYGIWKI